MDAPTIAMLRRLDAAVAALENALPFACEEYANGGGRGTPGVDRHFTAGNEERYGWEPLSRFYWLAKQRGLTRQGGGFLSRPQHITPEAFKAMTRGRKGSKLSFSARFQSSTGQLVGIGAGKNLPMLVRTGALRAAVTGRTATVKRIAPNVVEMTWTGLPDYALYLHTGTPRMPKRSPVEPGPEDVAAIEASMQRFIDAATGTGGAVPQSFTTIPGQARTALPAP